MLELILPIPIHESHVIMNDSFFGGVVDIVALVNTCKYSDAIYIYNIVN